MKTFDDIYESLIQNHLLLVESDRQFFARFKLSQVRFFALMHISQNPAISLTELSRKLLCTKGNTTRIIQGMETDGLLEVIKNQNDQRAFHLHLTGKGLATFHQVKLEFEKFNQHRFAGLGEEKEYLLGLVAKMKNGLEKSIHPLDK